MQVHKSFSGSTLLSVHQFKNKSRDGWGWLSKNDKANNSSSQDGTGLVLQDFEFIHLLCFG